MARKIENYFTNAGTTESGIIGGLSRVWNGKGDVEFVTLDNPHNIPAVMERREFGIDETDWMPAGGVTRNSIQRLNLYSSGFEFRARLLDERDDKPIRLTIRTLEQAHRGLRTDHLVEAFSEGNIIGFVDADVQGVIAYGNYEELLVTSAFLFFCYDTDPVKQATFGGAWEKNGVDYRKLHVSNEQLLLTTVVADYLTGGTGTDGNTGTGGGTGSGTDGGTDGGNNGGGDTGGGDTGGGTTPVIGVVGQAPPAYTGAPSLQDIPNEADGGFVVSIYGGGTGVEFQWRGVTSYDPSIHRYELVVNGIIRFRGDGNAYLVEDLQVGSHTAFIRLVDDNGNFGPALSRQFITTISQNTGGGTGSGGSGNPTTGGSAIGGGGTVTPLSFTRIDATDKQFVDGGVDNDVQQVWVEKATTLNFTGSGYQETTDSSEILGEGSKIRYNNFPDTSGAKPVFARIQANDVGDAIGSQASSSGDRAAVLAKSTDWEWVRLPIDARTNDNSYEIWGVSGLMKLDALLVADPGETRIPTGEEGFVTE